MESYLGGTKHYVIFENTENKFLLMGVGRTTWKHSGTATLQSVPKSYHAEIEG